MCLYPKIIKNKKYSATIKNGGVVPLIKDKRTEFVAVGCGKCMECMKQKSRAWQIRLYEEIKTDKTGQFVVLTFSNEEYKKLASEFTLQGYELDNQIAKLAVKRFLERWRKKYKKSIKHWLVTELGHNGTENIHLHGLLFTDKPEDIENKWEYGFVFKGDRVNEASISYITKYVTKIDEMHKYYTQIILTSPGIGKGYLKSYNAKKNKYNANDTDETYTNRQGYKMNLPKYYRNKIYSDEERENLWINLLDKQERYVNGIKIDISQDEKTYYNVLKIQQRRNKELGYGNDEINWEKRRYETTRRILKQQERLKH